MCFALHPRMNHVLPRCRYPLAVTRHKDSESTSTSIYTQNDPWEPVVSFEDYIKNNENITNQVRLTALSNKHPKLITRA